MRAAVLPGINKRIEIIDKEKPSIGPDEVLIEQKITGICYRDILTQQGFFPRVKTPITPGHEITGTVVKVGKNVSDFRVGQRVSSLIYEPCGVCAYCKSGRENLCRDKKTFGEILDGAYAQFVKVNRRSLVSVPEGVSEEGSAIAACVTGMLYHALVVEGGLSAGQTVLITGAGGGIGSNAVQLAKALGAHVIGETSSQWKAERIKSLGAEMVVSAADDFDRSIKKEYPDGVDVALECVGKWTFSKGLRSLANGGTMVVVGNVVPDPVELPLGLIILKGNRIVGSISSTRSDVAKVLEMESRGQIKPIVDRKVKLDNVEDAYEEIREKRNFGRVMLDLT